jgi:hypothetical protein
MKTVLKHMLTHLGSCNTYLLWYIYRKWRCNNWKFNCVGFFFFFFFFFFLQIMYSSSKLNPKLKSATFNQRQIMYTWYIKLCLFKLYQFILWFVKCINFPLHRLKILLGEKKIIVRIIYNWNQIWNIKAL